MNFTLIIPFALVVLLWVFSSAFRTYVLYALGWIIGNAPTLRWIAGVIGAIIVLILFLGASWIGFWAILGNWALSPAAGLIVGTGSLIGIFFFRGILRTVAVVGLVVIIFGLFFPGIKGAWNRYSAAGQVEIANKVDTKTAQMHPQGVSPAVATDDAVLYDDNGNPLSKAVKKGTVLKTVGLERRQFPGGPDTFVQVMLPNVNGDFLGGSTGWVPVHKIKFGLEQSDPPSPKIVNKTIYVPVLPPKTNVAPTVSKPSAPAAPSVPQEENWNLQFYRGRQLFEQNVSVTRNGSEIFMRARQDGTIFRGTLRGGWYQGTVTGGGSPNGTFVVQFNGDQANGSLISDEHITFQMKRRG